MAAEVVEVGYLRQGEIFNVCNFVNRPTHLRRLYYICLLSVNCNEFNNTFISFIF